LNFSHKAYKSPKKEALKIIENKINDKIYFVSMAIVMLLKQKKLPHKKSKEIKNQNFHKIKIVVDISIAANFYGKANDVMRIYYHFYWVDQ